MGQQLTVYAVPAGHVLGVVGSKRQDIYEAFLTWDDNLDEIDRSLKESAEAWAEDPREILASRDALKHIIFDLEMDPRQSGVYAYAAELICQVASTEFFTDWYGPGVLTLFEQVEAAAKARRKKLDMLNLVFMNSPFSIPDNDDFNIGAWNTRWCRRNQKTLKMLLRKGPKSSSPEDKENHELIPDVLSWVEAALKEKDGALIGILY